MIIRRKQSLLIASTIPFGVGESGWRTGEREIAEVANLGCNARRTTLAGCKSESAESTLSKRDGYARGGELALAILITDAEARVNNLPGEH
jgi:hypothetical protein